MYFYFPVLQLVNFVWVALVIVVALLLEGHCSVNPSQDFCPVNSF